VLYVFWKFFKRTKFVRLETMDFFTGRRELGASLLCPSPAFFRRSLPVYRTLVLLPPLPFF
jgi:hypothetical protein